MVHKLNRASDRKSQIYVTQEPFKRNVKTSSSRRRCISAHSSSVWRAFSAWTQNNLLFSEKLNTKLRNMFEQGKGIKVHWVIRPLPPLRLLPPRPLHHLHPPRRQPHHHLPLLLPHHLKKHETKIIIRNTDLEAHRLTKIFFFLEIFLLF